jgi:hypothetical protein
MSSANIARTLCIAYTKTGNPCRYAKKETSDYCGVHRRLDLNPSNEAKVEVKANDSLMNHVVSDRKAITDCCQCTQMTMGGIRCKNMVITNDPENAVCHRHFEFNERVNRERAQARVQNELKDPIHLNQVESEYYSQLERERKEEEKKYLDRLAELEQKNRVDELESKRRMRDSTDAERRRNEEEIKRIRNYSYELNRYQFRYRCVAENCENTVYFDNPFQNSENVLCHLHYYSRRPYSRRREQDLYSESDSDLDSDSDIDELVQDIGHVNFGSNQRAGSGAGPVQKPNMRTLRDGECHICAEENKRMIMLQCCRNEMCAECMTKIRTCVCPFCKKDNNMTYE